MGVKQALLALPAHFSAPDIHISGVRATEVYTLAAALGATIEDQVVATLNRMRDVWDPDERYRLFNFVRQPQTFPDVLLQKRAEGKVEIALGIELKGWYLLSKEREPTFRYRVSPKVCTVWDLLVVVPWFLSDVIAGVPRVLAPYIESAKYAAEYRNYWWQHVRRSDTSVEIEFASHASPYPSKADQIVDKPVADTGGNFGRLARTGLMDEYMEETLEEPIAGISARHWREFFKVFSETAAPAEIQEALQRLARDAPSDRQAHLERAVSAFSEALRVLLEGE
jgi:hypothetical protein